MSAINIPRQEEQNNRVEPRKFSLWLLIIGMTMLFAAFTSAYIVRQAEGNWYRFDLSPMFLYSTIVVVMSSVTMIVAYKAAKNDELGQLKVGITLTILLGLAFTYLQWLGWQDMIANNLFFTNPDDGTKVSASFLYVISGVHLLHLLGGIIFLLVMLIKALNLQVHKKNLLSINMCNTYWHFVGILWVYLYLFFYLTKDF
jgi:cytochrome c oxidase subunit 3